jgi:hypothetical protein
MINKHFFKTVLLFLLIIALGLLGIYFTNLLDDKKEAPQTTLSEIAE